MESNGCHKQYRAPAVQRAFGLLEIIARSPQGLSLSELARQGNLSKSSAHGITKALLDLGILVHNPDSPAFHLGPAIFELAFSNWNVFRLRDLAEPRLAALRDQTGETVFLGFQVSYRVVIIAAAESMNALTIASPSGTSIPLLAGAVGKALLASRSDEEAMKLARKQGLRKFTSQSITEPDAYLAELQRVRQLGYALDDEEYLPGIRAVAVALGNKRGLPLLLWLVGFSGSLSDHRLELAAKSVLNAAAELKLLLDSQA